MGVINSFSAVAMPAIILIIVIYAIVEKKKIYDSFIVGVKEGIELVISLFPTLLGLIVAVGALRSSGVLDLLVNVVAPLVTVLEIPKEVIPLAMLRPISGSAAMAIAIDMLNQFGPDSLLGRTISTIMGSTETTFYTIAIYTAAVGIKKIRYILFAALIGDFVGMVTASIVCQFIGG